MRLVVDTGAVGVDIQTTATDIARIDTEFLRSAALPDIHEDIFDTLLVKVAVFTIGDQIGQQPFVIDLSLYRICTLAQSGCPVTGQLDLSK